MFIKMKLNGTVKARGWEDRRSHRKYIIWAGIPINGQRRGK